MGFVHSQLFVKLPYPTSSYTGQTIIVTGSNQGLGKEAARHFARLGASTLILCVRSLDKGNAAREDILTTTKSTNPTIDIQVWHVDMSSYSSVQAFAQRVNGLPRLDIFLANAGVAKSTWSLAEGHEEQIAVNVISTFLLSLLVLPIFKRTAKQYNTRPTLTITSSGAHAHTKFPQKHAPEGKIFESLKDEKTYKLTDRYPVSKLLEVYCVREIAKRYPKEKLGVTVNCVSPGLCESELAREAGWQLRVMKFLLARTTEEGSRTLVHACDQGAESHGAYLSDCKITEPEAVVTDVDGVRVQPRVWDELVGILESIAPGCTKSLG